MTQTGRLRYDARYFEPVQEQLRRKGTLTRHFRLDDGQEFSSYKTRSCSWTGFQNSKK